MADILWPLARDSKDEWVHISEATHDIEYFCPECGSRMTARLGLIKQHHFAHYPDSGLCAGESSYHILAKHMLAYYLERNREIKYSSRCPKCARVLPNRKEITEVQIEKGIDDYRPDLLIKFTDGDSAYGEIVYRNPLAEKAKKYEQENANLLAWFIDGQVDKVPSIELWTWNHIFDDLSSKRGGGKLYFISDFPVGSHTCAFKPRAAIQIYQVPCWRCGRDTKVVFLRDIWLESGQGSYQPEDATIRAGEEIFLMYLRHRDVPKDIWVQINKRFGTKYFPDKCTAYQEFGGWGFYLINHCQWCGIIQGDGATSERILEKGMKPLSIEIEFSLTK